MSVFRFSDRVPKMAWTLLPTVRTPAAPSALILAWSAREMSFTPTRRRVMHASRSWMLLRPPNARTSWRAKSSAASAPEDPSATASSRPGVFMLSALMSP